MAGVPHVFISHATHDVAFARQLADDLRAAGADVWLDATHIGPGDFVTRINQALNTRDVLILVLSPAALESQWVPDEVNAAIVRYKQGFMRAPVVVVAESVPLRDIPGLWTTYNRIDATKDYRAAFSLVLKALEIPAPPAPPPASRPSVEVAAPAPTTQTSPIQHVTPPAPAKRAHVSLRTAKPKIPSLRTLNRPAKTFLLLLAIILVVSGGLLGLRSVIGSSQANQNTGHAQNTPLPTHSPAPVAPRWKYGTGNAITSVPAVAGGMVYVGSGDGSVYALNSTNGEKSWSVRLGSRAADTPAVVNNNLYIASNDGYIYDLDTSKGGARIWRTTIVDGPASMPVIVGAVVYVAAGELWSSQFLYALKANDGTILWKRQIYTCCSTVLGAPAVVNGTIYLPGTNLPDTQHEHPTVIALNATIGTTLWERPVPGLTGSTGAYEGSMPTVDHGVVYGAYGNTVYALNPGDDTKSWSAPVGTHLSGTPTVANGVVYAGTGDNSLGDNSLYALDATQKGRTLWKFDAPGPLGGGGFATFANDVVYIGMSNGNVYALNVLDGAVRWTASTKGPVLSSPTVVGGIAYVGSTDAYVYAFKA